MKYIGLGLLAAVAICIAVAVAVLFGVVAYLLVWPVFSLLLN